MPNEMLVERLLALAEEASFSERVILKYAAALVRQLDDDYDIRLDFDGRVHMTMDEFDAVPDRIEMWNGIPRPKDWATPERLASNERYLKEIAELEMELGDHAKALDEHQRRSQQRREERRRAKLKQDRNERGPALRRASDQGQV